MRIRESFFRFFFLFFHEFITCSPPRIIQRLMRSSSPVYILYFRLNYIILDSFKLLVELLYSVNPFLKKDLFEKEGIIS